MARIVMMRSDDVTRMQKNRRTRYLSTMRGNRTLVSRKNSVLRVFPMPVWSWKHLTAVATFCREDHESEYDDDPKEGSSDPAFFDSKRKELNKDSYDQNLKSRLHRSFKRCEQKDLSEDVEEGLSSENDEEMRQWRQKLSILNKEMSRPPRAPSQRDKVCLLYAINLFIPFA